MTCKSLIPGRAVATGPLRGGEVSAADRSALRLSVVRLSVVLSVGEGPFTARPLLANSVNR